MNNQITSLYFISGILFIYAMVNQMIIMHKNAQMEFWKEERNKEILHHKAQLQADLEGKPQPFPPGRVIKEGLAPLPPEPVKQEMNQQLFDSLEYEVLKMRGNSVAKYSILKKLRRDYPQFA